CLQALGLTRITRGTAGSHSHSLELLAIFVGEGNITNRWTRGSIACFASCFTEFKIVAGARPRQLNRYVPLHNIMNSISSLALLLPLFLVACARPQTTPPSAAAIQSTPTASPASIPTPEPSPKPNPEISLANGLKIVPRTITLENERRRYQINVTFPQIE